MDIKNGIHLLLINKTIINKNNKYQTHGYQEWYTPFTNKLRFRGNYKNGKVIAYHEYHGSIKTLFYIK
jgi:hypothetical protein